MENLIYSCDSNYNKKQQTLVLNGFSSPYIKEVLIKFNPNKVETLGDLTAAVQHCIAVMAGLQEQYILDIVRLLEVQDK